MKLTLGPLESVTVDCDCGLRWDYLQDHVRCDRCGTSPEHEALQGLYKQKNAYTTNPHCTTCRCYLQPSITIY